MKYYLPVGTAQLAGRDRPEPAQGIHGQSKLDRRSKRSEPLGRTTMKTHGGIVEGMAFTTLAGLKGLDTGVPQHLHGVADPAIQGQNSNLAVVRRGFAEFRYLSWSHT